MYEELRNIFNFAIANRATFSLLPHFHRAFITAAQVQAVLVDEDAVLRVHHAEATSSQVAVVYVGRVVVLRVVQRRSAAGRWRGIKYHLPMAFLRELLDTCQNSLAVSFLIRILLDVRGGLAGGKIVLRVETLCGDRRRRTYEEAIFAGRQELLARVLARTQPRILPLQRLRPKRHILSTNALNQLIFYLVL